MFQWLPPALFGFESFRVFAGVSDGRRRFLVCWPVLQVVEGTLVDREFVDNRFASLANEKRGSDPRNNFSNRSKKSDPEVEQSKREMSGTHALERTATHSRFGCSNLLYNTPIRRAWSHKYLSWSLISCNWRTDVKVNQKGFRAAHRNIDIKQISVSATHSTSNVR